MSGHLSRRQGPRSPFPLPSTAIEASDASRVMAQPEFSRWTNCYCWMGQRLAGTLGGRAVPNGVGQWISNHPEAGSTDKVILLELGSSGSLARTALGSLPCPVTRNIRAILNKTGWPDALFFLT